MQPHRYLHCATQGDLRLSVVPTANLLEVHRFHTDPRAVIEPGLPALVVRRIFAMGNTLPAVEVRGAAKYRQVHIEFKLQTTENYVCDFVVEGARWDRCRCMPHGGAVQ